MLKKVNIDKVKAEFDKCNLDEQIKAYHSLKEWLNEKITTKINSLDVEKENYSTVQERL